MESLSVRCLIREKLADGRLPHDSVARLSGGPSNGETCDGCDERIAPGQFVMEGVSTAPVRRTLTFHMGCLHYWVLERLAHAR